MPAVAALVYELKPVLEPLRQSDPVEFDKAKQFIGWRVGEVMRQHGHTVARRQARVPGGLFTVAAVWTPGPESNAQTT